MIMRSGDWWAQKGKIQDMDDDLFYFEVTHAQSPEARFDAVFELFRHYQVNVLKRDESELRLQRTASIVKYPRG